MKTNYFILNFINPSRLVYFAKPAQSSAEKKSDTKKEAPKDKEGDLKKEEAPKVARDAQKQTEEAGKQLIEKRKTAEDQLRSKQKELFKARKKRLEEQKPYLQTVAVHEAGRLSGNAFREAGKSYAKALKKEHKLKSEIEEMGKEYRKLIKAHKAVVAVAETEVAQKSAPTKEMVAEIFKGKKDNLQKLLEYFTKEGYRKGKRDWVKYNTEVLNILDKKGANNKKEWIIAFQEWAGAGKDGAVGPNTMLALAGKIGEVKIGKKIKRTMIAKRSKKKIPSKGVVVQKPITTEESGRSAGEVATGGVYYNTKTNEYASYTNAEDVPRGWVRSTKDEVAIALGEEGEKKIKIASAETEQMSQMPEDWEREGIETDEGQAVASLDEKKKKEEDKG